jgi:hypothetical protein
MTEREQSTLYQRIWRRNIHAKRRAQGLCIGCGKFPPAKSKSGYCEKCLAKARAEYKPFDRRHKHRFWAIKRKYGIGETEFAQLLEAQNGKCAICGIEPPPPLAETEDRRKHNGKILKVDHDHETNEVRGLLCNGCNIGLGGFADDPSRLWSAMQYLLKHRKVSEVG